MSCTGQRELAWLEVGETSDEGVVECVDKGLIRHSWVDKMQFGLMLGHDVIVILRQIHKYLVANKPLSTAFIDLEKALRYFIIRAMRKMEIDADPVCIHSVRELAMGTVRCGRWLWCSSLDYPLSASFHHHARTVHSSCCMQMSRLSLPWGNCCWKLKH